MEHLEERGTDRNRSSPPLAPRAVGAQIRFWVAGLLLAVAGLAFSIVLLMSPAVFQMYYPRMKIAPEVGDAVRIVHWLSGDADGSALNFSLRRKISAKEINHFTEVRRLFRKFPLVGAACLAAALGLLVMNRSQDKLFQKVSWRALGVWLLLAAVMGAFAVYDWPAFFAAIHYPFFGKTSWRLPDSCYSLHLFPTAFWKAMAGAVFVMTPSLAACFSFVAARLIRSAHFFAGSNRRSGRLVERA